MSGIRLQSHFEDLTQQGHAARVGMWIFIGSEALLFGALFALFAGYRLEFPAEFRAAAGTTNFGLGIAMTFTLLTASFLLTEAAEQVREAHYRATSWLLGVVFILGLGFIALKGIEWGEHFAEGLYPGPYYRYEALPGRGPKIFYSLYYVMTGLHLLHMIGGVVAVATLWVMNGRRRFTPEYAPHLELTGLYWQFVDIVWLFLWSLMYLLR